MPIDAQQVKVGVISVTTTTATASSDVIDTKGFHYLTINASCNVADATNASQKFQVLDIYHSANSDGSSGTAYVSGTTNSTASSSQFVINAYNDTSVRRVSRINVALQGTHERYHWVQVQAPADTAMDDVQVWYELSRAEESPNTAAEAGCADFAQF